MSMYVEEAWLERRMILSGGLLGLWRANEEMKSVSVVRLQKGKRHVKNGGKNMRATEKLRKPNVDIILKVTPRDMRWWRSKSKQSFR